MRSRFAAPTLSSTPVRLAGILILVFSLSMLAGFGATFMVIRNQLNSDLEHELAQIFQSYNSISSQAELEERIAEDVTIVDHRNTVLVYLTDRGRRITNFDNFPVMTGQRIINEKDMAAVEGNPADSYLVSSAVVGRGVLLVAKGRDQIIELAEIFSTVLMFSFLPTLLIASAIGFWVARQARKRVEAIQAALEAMTAGRLDARVAGAEKATDDLSQIGLSVNRMGAAQAASVDSLRQISADIAHDLKTPIQRVSVLLERLGDTPGLSADARRIVERAQSETVDIVRTFQSLLQIAQLEGGAVRERFVPVDLGALAESLVEVFEPAAAESGHVLRWQADASPQTAPQAGPQTPFMVMGDRNLLGQILANLIENALRHTPAGGTVTVGLSRLDGGRRIMMRLRDTGPGIPEHERQNVLRRLYRLERSRTSEGSGLGLSLVAAIAELHGAELRLENADPGLAVCLEFPAMRDSGGAAVRPGPRPA